MKPSLWGSSLWASLIYIVLNYPDKDPSPAESQAFMDYFEKLGAVLPCNVCRNHYQRDFPSHLPQLENRESLFIWLLELHNRSNPKNKFNRQQFLKRYTPKCQLFLNNSKDASEESAKISRKKRRDVLKRKSIQVKS